MRPGVAAGKEAAQQLPITRGPLEGGQDVARAPRP